MAKRPTISSRLTELKNRTAALALLGFFAVASSIPRR